MLCPRISFDGSELAARGVVRVGRPKTLGVNASDGSSHQVVEGCRDLALGVDFRPRPFHYVIRGARPRPGRSGRSRRIDGCNGQSPRIVDSACPSQQRVRAGDLPIGRVKRVGRPVRQRVQFRNRPPGRVKNRRRPAYPRGFCTLTTRPTGS